MTSSKPPRTDASAGDAPTLGDDLKRLEEIVRRLEDDTLELETALQLFEEGVGKGRTDKTCNSCDQITGHLSSARVCHWL